MRASVSPSVSTDLLGRWVGAHPALWIRLGNLESKILSADLEEIEIRAPIYVCGLARSGSTALLELLAAQHGVASHRYEDFPFVFTPYWWNKVLRFAPLRDKRKRERAHGDGIMVSPASPEAMEEMLWMAFFEHTHSPHHSQILDAAINYPNFERFYRHHMQKLLLARKGTRYLCKGNYHITRMAYLLKLFPDARFVIPVREPVGHVASLMRQHRRFCEAGKTDARVARHMAIAGHFEFGLNRTPIHTGDDAAMREILAAWRQGEEARGWALYWAMIHSFLHRQLESSPALQRQCMVIPFEQLHAAPRDTLYRLLEHTDLPVEESFIGRQAAGIRRADYAMELTPEEVELIRQVTAPAAQLFGYPPV